jgi:hypothetical protein
VARARWCRVFDHSREAVSPIPGVPPVGDHPVSARAGLDVGERGSLTCGAFVYAPLETGSGARYIANRSSLRGAVDRSGLVEQLIGRG